jgi:hypothetical protein
MLQLGTAQAADAVSLRGKRDEDVDVEQDGRRAVEVIETKPAVVMGAGKRRPASASSTSKGQLRPPCLCLCFLFFLHRDALMALIRVHTFVCACMCILFGEFAWRVAGGESSYKLSLSAMIRSNDLLRDLESDEEDDVHVSQVHGTPRHSHGHGHGHAIFIFKTEGE